MPAFWPSSETEVSQLPRWPTATLSVSSARAASVEAEVSAHPDVDLAAAVAVPDPVFGERVCAVVTMRAPGTTLTLDQLREFLAGRGVGKEYFPEYLAVVDEMPQSSGGKIAKNELRSALSERFAQ